MSVWPSAVASNANLYVAVDFPNSVTALNGAINSSVTSINVTNASNYPSSGGYILIDNELIYFSGTSGNTLTGCLRGQDGTLAASHLNNAVVNLIVVAEHHNVLKDEIIAIETSLNLTPSFALVSDVSGRVNVSSTTSIEIGYVHGVTSSIQTQLNGKQASLGYTPVNKAGDSMSGSLTMLSQYAILFQDTGVNTVTLEAPNTISSSYVLKFPATQSSGTQVLANDGSGNLSWENAPTTPVSVINGGTGQTTYTDGQLLIGDSSTNGLDTATLTGTSNQIIVTNGHGSITLSTPLTSAINYTLPPTRGMSGYFLQTDGSTSTLVWASGGSGVSSITGTTHQIIASASTGAVTLSTPQDIDTTSSPTFMSLVLNNSTVGDNYLQVEDNGQSGYFGVNGSLGVVYIGTGLPFASNAVFSARPGGNTVISSSSGSVGLNGFAGVSADSTFTVTTTTNQLVLGTTNTTTISAPAPSASRTYTIPDALVAANFVLSVPYVSLMGQTSSISTTTLFTPSVTGTYRVSIYIVDTAGSIFTLQGTIGWTDDITAQTATTSTLTNMTDGYLQSSFFIEATLGNAVTYAVALTGTATYSLYVVSERLS